MKETSHTLLVISAVVATVLLLPAGNARGQYVTLTAGGPVPSSETLTVASNEVATIVHLSTVDNASAIGGTTNGPLAWLEVVCKGVTNFYCASFLNREGPYSSGSNSWNAYTAHAGKPVIAGPATIRMRSVGAFYMAGLCTLQISKPASTFVPLNTVVIPNDNGSPVQIMLESSTDMINWTSANPGTYGSSAANRFFRVRAER